MMFNPVKLFEQFNKNNGTFPWELAIASSALALIAFVGITLNSSIVYVTARSRLRGTTHFLLVLVSVFEVLHQSSHFVYFYNVFFGRPRFIDYALCVRLQTLPMFGLNALQMALLSTAFDRLIATQAPIFYKLNNESGGRKALYLGAFTFVIFGYGFFSAGFFIWRATIYSGAGSGGQIPPPVICDITDTFYDEVLYAYFSRNTLILDIFCVILYAFLWYGFLKNIQATDMQRHILKSLITIVVVNVGGYFVNVGLITLGRMFLSWPWIWYQIELNGVLLNMAAASNAPILYLMSYEYREAFNKYLVRPLKTTVCRRWTTSSN